MDCSEKIKIYFEVERNFHIQDIVVRLVEDYGFSEEDAKESAPKIVDTFQKYLNNNEAYFEYYWDTVDEAIQDCMIRNMNGSQLCEFCRPVIESDREQKGAK